MSMRRDAVEQVPEAIDDRTMPVGRYKGTLMRELPDDYVRWLADPARETVPEGKNYRPFHPSLLAWARERLAKIEERGERERFAKRCLGGFPTGLVAPIYVIECEGDCYSKSGEYAIDNQWFVSLSEALAYLLEEYPVEPRTKGFDPDAEEEEVRSSPDPEDDRILVWEVLPSGHRKAVWGFFGWHHGAGDYECGQGALPGDDVTLYEIACRDI